MTRYKSAAAFLATAALLSSVPASAQFGAIGGFGKKLLGGGSDDAVSSADAGLFLTGAMKSTKNVMISAALLAQALKDRGGLASRKAQIDAITNAQNFGELNGQRTQLQEDLTALSARQDLAGDLKAAYQAGDAQQQKVIGVAIANLALGVYRNVQLAGAAPGMVKSIGSNPKFITRIGEFKTAATLVGLQGKSLVSIGGALPKVMGALKIKPLPEAETTEPVVASL